MTALFTAAKMYFMLKDPFNEQIVVHMQKLKKKKNLPYYSLQHTDCLISLSKTHYSH